MVYRCMARTLSYVLNVCLHMQFALEIVVMPSRSLVSVTKTDALVEIAETHFLNLHTM